MSHTKISRYLHAGLPESSLHIFHSIPSHRIALQSSEHCALNKCTSNSLRTEMDSSDTSSPWISSGSVFWGLSFILENIPLHNLLRCIWSRALALFFEAQDCTYCTSPHCTNSLDGLHKHTVWWWLMSQNTIAIFLNYFTFIIVNLFMIFQFFERAKRISHDIR